MKFQIAARPASTAPVALLLSVALLSGCTVFGDGMLSGGKVDYKNNPVRTKGLEVPPDLSQLARDSRYQPQGGVVSASSIGAAPTAATAPAAAGPATVAVSTQGALRIERRGQQRWLVSAQTPEQLWPQLRAFWTQNGFVLAEDNPQVGVMETNWNENRAKLPNDVVRNTIGRVFGNLYDTGERDRFRTRLERTAEGTEIYVTHRGAAEVFANERRESTVWQARPNDPQLEAEFLSRMMVALGGKDEPAARAAVAGAATTPQAATATRVETTSNATSLVVDEPFDRAWRRIGVALDRGGFTVEDRDRSAGIYYVRYIDPKNADKEEPGFWSKLFGNTSNPLAAQRYRIVVKGSGDKSDVSVQNSSGAAEIGDNAKRIIGLLANELR